MLQLAVAYVHLLATCLALGTVLLTDWHLFRGRYHPLRQGVLSRLLTTRRIASGALITLWATGLLLTWIGYAADPSGYFLNPKWWAKVTVVAVLIVNGYLLHALVFPKLQTTMALMDLPSHERNIFALLGAMSCVSWLFAAFLGVARAWNGSVPYAVLLTIYVALAVIGVCIGLVCFADRAAYRDDRALK